MADVAREPDESWQELAPLLEQMVARLGRREREAILLRFYQQMPLRDVGRVLGISEEAAKKRVSRAVQELRGLCSKRGLALAAGLSAELLERNVSQAAPGGLAASAANAALVTGAAKAGVSAISQGALRMMAMATLKLAAAFCVLLCALLAVTVLAMQETQPKTKVRAEPTLPATQTATTRAGGTTPPAALMKPPRNPDAVRKAVLARLAALQSISVEYDVEESFFPRNVPRAATQPWPGSLPVAGQTFQIGNIKTGTDRSTGRFSYLKGSARWEIRISDETQAAMARQRTIPIVEQVYTSAAGRLEQLAVRTDGPLGSIEARSVPMQPGAVDLGLGLRDVWQGQPATWWESTGGWLTPERLNGMEIAEDEAGRVVFYRSNRLGHPLEWVFDPMQGYSLVAYHRRATVNSQPIVDEVTSTDFRSVSGVLLPFLITERTLHTDGYEVKRWQARVKQYALSDPGNTPERYHIGWRQGMTVIDRRTGHVFRIHKDGVTLTDDAIAQALSPAPPGPSTRPVELEQ